MLTPRQARCSSFAFDKMCASGQSPIMTQPPISILPVSAFPNHASCRCCFLRMRRSHLRLVMRPCLRAFCLSISGTRFALSCSGKPRVGGEFFAVLLQPHCASCIQTACNFDCSQSSQQRAFLSEQHRGMCTVPGICVWRGRD